ncbi:MAG TPA: hypothetical protein VJ714_08075 [Anaerolineae bacterium]|nr:hypothetical protein [Anaerolineae bacterium]
MSKKPLVLALALASSLSLLTLSLVSASKTALGQGNLLANPDFEAGTSGWNVSYAATAVTVTTPVQSGNWAAALNRSDAGFEISIYQDVMVIPGATYTLTGWIYKDEDAFKRACLRIDWRDPQWPPLDSDWVTDDHGYYRPITVGPVTPPPDASKARISAVAEIRTAGPPNPIYFDDLRLTSNMMPTGCLPLLLKNYQG